MFLLKAMRGDKVAGLIRLLAAPYPEAPPLTFDGNSSTVADKIHGFMPATFDPPSDRRRLFLRYVTGVLIDLAVFGLFADYWSSAT